MPSCQAGSLDKKVLCCVKLSALRPNCVTGPGGSDERTDEAAAAGPSDIQRLRGIGDVGCPRRRGVVGVALAGAPDRGHVADTNRTIRGRAVRFLNALSFWTYAVASAKTTISTTAFTSVISAASRICWFRLVPAANTPFGRSPSCEMNPVSSNISETLGLPSVFPVLRLEYLRLIVMLYAVMSLPELLTR